MEVLWKDLEVCDTRGSRLQHVRYMEAHGCFHGTYSRKLQSMEAMDACTDSGNFHVFLTNFHGIKSTSDDFHGHFHVSIVDCIEVHFLHRNVRGSE